jgi:hypothetical protein
MEQVIRHINCCNIFLCDAYEIYAHTVFEPSAKKQLPFFSCFVKKETPSMASDKIVFPKFASCLSTFSVNKVLSKICFVSKLFVVDAI